MSGAIKVYVHLARGYDARAWRRRWQNGDLIGFNDPSPYGYHHAHSPSARLAFSIDDPETRLGRWIRGGLRLVLGFDMVHAWRNREALREADVVWTHTESQHLAIATLLKTMRKGRRPKLLAQSVWLMDNWDRFGALRRGLYRWLIAEADVLTFHSPLNRDKAKALFPEKWCEFLPFGICTDLKQVPTTSKSKRAEVRVAALGNDRHRDWATLLEAFGGRPGFVLRIASSALQTERVAAFGNVEIVTPELNRDLLALYRWADVVALPLQENLHASGTTVLQEAVLAGRPVVCTRTGGLDTYFGDEEVAFVPPGDPDRLSEAAANLASHPAKALTQAVAAQRRMAVDGLHSRSFAQSHLAISRLLLEFGPALHRSIDPRPPQRKTARADANC